MIISILLILVACIILTSFMMRREALRREYEHERRQERIDMLIRLLQKSSSDENANPDSYRGSDPTGV
jgi:hypothetical protein